MEQSIFTLKSCKNLKFRFKKIPAIQLAALQTQLNFDDFKKAEFSMTFVLEHTEVEVDGQWLPVKEPGRDVFTPVTLNDNILAIGEITKVFLKQIIAPLFQNSNG